MTRLLLVSAVIAVLPVVATAQSPTSPIPWANKLFVTGIEKNPTQPVPATIGHDFGVVPQGTLCVHKFTFTNIYDVPLQVLDVRKSCGCLEAYPPQKVLQPNESADFTVSMNAGKFSGPNTQTLHVTVGPTYVSVAVLKLTANSRSDVQVNPGGVNFGTVAVGAKSTQVVTVEYSGKQKDWKITGVVPPAGPFDVTVKEAPRGLLSTPMALLGGAVKFTVSVTLKADAGPGSLAEVINLKTNDPAASVVAVNVSGIVEAPLTLSTDVVRFDRVKVGESVTQKLIVRAASGPFKIQSVTDDGDGISVETFPAPAPVQIVTIRFTPTKVGAVKRALRLKTDLGGGATTTLGVEGEGVE